MKKVQDHGLHDAGHGHSHGPSAEEIKKINDALEDKILPGIKALTIQ